LALTTALPNSAEYKSAKTLIESSFRRNSQASSNTYFDQIIILGVDENILLATSEPWLQENMGSANEMPLFIRSLMGTNRSIFVYNPLPSYANALVLFTSRSFVDDQGNLAATLVASSTSEQAYRLLADSRSFLTDAQSYYFTGESGLIGLMEAGKLAPVDGSPSLISSLKPLIGSQRTHALFGSRSLENRPTIVYADWLPEYELGVVLSVSEQSIFEKANFFDPFNLVVLAVSLAISASLIYFGSTRLVNPLVQLTHAVDRFSKGNWEERTRITRHDEIGLLADTFNRMADELSDQHRSLEAVVQKRTRQLQTASEVVQMATSTASRADILKNLVQLITQHFDLYYAAVYLLDESSQTLVLKEASGPSENVIKERKDVFERSPHSLVGLAAVSNETRVVSNLQPDPLFILDPLLADKQSEIAVPLSVGNEVLGVLLLQSTAADTFDTESIAVYQTLASQISNAFQNIRVLETAQISYQETALLYRATRLITQARSEEEVIQKLTDVFVELPFVCAILSRRGKISDRGGDRFEDRKERHHR
jgi:HAMP domain-containing protein